MVKQCYKNLLHKMVCTTNTDLWNDSCSVEELTYAIDSGAVGATTNPPILSDVLKKEMHRWKDRITQLVEEMPTATEDDITWRLIEEMAVKGAELLKPVFNREKEKKGRISIQVNPKYFKDKDFMIRQALHFHNLAPNMQVKIPVTKVGLQVMEQITYQGVNVNGTVCFTVPQCLAVVEAIEKGLNRREKEGKDISTMSPVCTLMIGRLDDWLKFVSNRDDITINPCCMEWAGIAVVKKTYRLFQERSSKVRLLSGAFRNDLHWSEIIGGDLVITIPYRWQKRFNGSDIEVISRIDKPVDQTIIAELSRKFEGFRKAYDEEGMTVDEFETYPPTRRTLRQFTSAYEDLVRVIRDFIIPNPETK